MKQCSLFMRVARAMISWKASYTLVILIKIGLAHAQHEYLAVSVPVQTDKGMDIEHQHDAN